jgi:hypothetical protein
MAHLYILRMLRGEGLTPLHPFGRTCRPVRAKGDALSDPLSASERDQAGERGAAGRSGARAARPSRPASGGVRLAWCYMTSYRAVSLFGVPP